MKDFKKGSRFADDMRLMVTALVLASLLAGCSLPAPGPATTPSPTPSASPTVESPPITHALRFDGASAFNDTAAQVLAANGSTRYRVPNSTGNDEVARWASSQFNASGWNVSWQGFTAQYGCVQMPMHNVVAERAGSSGRIVILGAHYDTRPIAESEKNESDRAKPIPGANDGASGVGVLVELARILPPLNDTVRLVLFDGEDGGEYLTSKCTDWLLGSTAYARSLNASDVKATSAMILVDMAGDPHLRLPREMSSTTSLADRVYAIGGGLGYADVFVNDTKYGDTYQITDDHAPFLARGIPSLDLIHLERGIVFPEWHHTLHDDLSHVDQASLAKVGRTLELWLLEESGPH